MTSATLLWATTIIMLVGGLLILAKGKHRTPSEGLQTMLHGVIPIIAACAYFAMATGQGSIMLPSHGDTGVAGMRIFYFARYVDWAFTTPLLLLSLGMSAMHAGHKRAGLLLGAGLADLLMIVTAFAFGASETGWTQWTWFAVSCAAFLGVYYVIWMPQMAVNRLERDDVQAAYLRNATVLSVLWLIYPLILAVAPDGLGIVSDPVSVLAIGVLDVLSKVAYGLMSVASDAKATERDLAEHGEVRATPLRAAA